MELIMSIPSKFQQMTDDCMLQCWDFLDNRSLITTAFISKSFNTPNLKEKRDERLIALRNDFLFCRTEGYPQKLFEAFRRNNQLIRDLPVLDVGRSHSRQSSYINDINPRNMSHPVMRFRDLSGHTGTIFNLEAEIKYQEIPGEPAPPKIYVLGTIAIYKYDVGSFASVYNTNGAFLSVIIDIEHRRHRNSDQGLMDECPTCLDSLVKGSGPVFKHAPIQVAQPVELPRIVPMDFANLLDRNAPRVQARSRYSSRALIVTAIAILAIAILAKYCLTSERS